MDQQILTEGRTLCVKQRHEDKYLAKLLFGYTHWVLDILQSGGKGVYELVRQLRQEADRVNVQDCHATGQLAGVNGDIQSGKQLVSGLKAAVASQRLDQGGFSWVRKLKQLDSEASDCSCGCILADRWLLPPQLVYPSTDTMGNSLCVRWTLSRCLFLLSFSSVERIFISRSFSSRCWTSYRVSPARTDNRA